MRGDSDKRGKRGFERKIPDEAGIRNSKESKCPVFSKCGGCQHLDIPYAEQVEIKQKNTAKLLDKFCKVDPMIPMGNPYHYRHKVHAVFHRKKDGTVVSGVYEEKTHNVLPVEHCYIENQKAATIIHSITGLIKSFKLWIYHEDTGLGLLRHVVIRVGRNSGQIMVVVVTASPIFPSKNNFVKALVSKHPEITTIVQNINDKQTSMVLGDRDIVMYGKGYIEDSLCGKRFRISPRSFFQVNPIQTEVLYETAISMAEMSGEETVMDAYCGIGTIGIIASEKAKKVMGVELNSEAVRDARINAKMNHVENIAFYNSDAGKFMMELAEQGEKIDVLFMDPPRSGSSEEFLQAVLKLAPQKVVYISCGPESLAKDLKYLTKGNAYKVKKICPVDMFPMTGHVETVVLMSRVKE